MTSIRPFPTPETPQSSPWRCSRLGSALTLLIFAFTYAAASAHATVSGPSELSNGSVGLSWAFDGKTLDRWAVSDQATGRKIDFGGDVFSIELADGTVIRSSQMLVKNPPRIEPLAANPDAARFAQRLPGQQVVIDFAMADGGIGATFRGIVRDGSRYVRQELRLEAVGKEIPLKQITLIQVQCPDAAVIGSVDGCVAAGANVFFAVEHPMSRSVAEAGRVMCSLPQAAPVPAGQSFTCSCVIGFVRPGQLRRDFLEYLEHERAHPYRPFLNYNTWYSIYRSDGYNDAAIVDVINTFGRELTQRRGVKVSSFLLDDGWDDVKTLWTFSDGFPQGLSRVREAAAKYGSAPGIWLSPWGGYGAARQQRLENGRRDGFETRQDRFAMARPKYYQRFRDLCVGEVQKDGVNQFKFDGIGADDASGAGAAAADFDAMLRLIAELRSLRPDLYINQTTGTWPSPFWLMHADSIWRGGKDHSFAGEGTDRQRWITYRDGETYRRVVSRSPLFPLSSLMLHGIIYARHAQKLNSSSPEDFKAELRSFFGSGTQMQELYVTPSLLTQEDWDALAQSAKWAAENAATLRDSHWIGGDPEKLEVYGWASWSAEKGILVLRNPNRSAARISVDAAKAFELPDDAPRRFALTTPYADQRKVSIQALEAGKESVFRLDPFEVLVFEARPVPDRQ